MKTIKIVATIIKYAVYAYIIYLIYKNDLYKAGEIFIIYVAGVAVGVFESSHRIVDEVKKRITEIQ